MHDVLQLSNIVRQAAYEIHIYHGHGHLEKVYENALAHRLRKLGLKVVQQMPLHVFDEDGTIIGDYVADMVVDSELLIELKAAKSIVPTHEAQLFAYLKTCRLRHGILINFGSKRFEIRKLISPFG